jgi:hypothetical protein
MVTLMHINFQLLEVAVYENGKQNIISPSSQDISALVMKSIILSPFHLNYQFGRFLDVFSPSSQ